MTDEKLIEEAAKAIHEVMASQWAVIASALKMDQAQYDTFRDDLARAAFAVFEKAHAPEKDERLARYMAMATPLGYQSALTVVQEMTKLLAAEDIARRNALGTP